MGNQDIRAGTSRLKYTKLPYTKAFFLLQVDEVVPTFGGDYKIK